MNATVVPVTLAYSGTTRTVTLTLAAPLANGSYRLEVSGAGGLIDAAGNPLDGDGNGAAGGAYDRTFTIDRSADHPPVAQGETVHASTGVGATVSLQATDVDGDALTYAIVTGPKDGTISGFDPSRGTLHLHVGGRVRRQRRDRLFRG